MNIGFDKYLNQQILERDESEWTTDWPTEEGHYFFYGHYLGDTAFNFYIRFLGKFVTFI